MLNTFLRKDTMKPKLNVSVELKNSKEFEELTLDVSKKALELQEAIKRLNDFELELETESASNH